MVKVWTKTWVIVTQKYEIKLVVFPQVVKVWTKTWVMVTQKYLIVQENVPDKQTHKQLLFNIDNCWKGNVIGSHSWLNQLLISVSYIISYLKKLFINKSWQGQERQGVKVHNWR